MSKRNIFVGGVGLRNENRTLSWNFFCFKEFVNDINLFLQKFVKKQFLCENNLFHRIFCEKQFWKWFLPSTNKFLPGGKGLHILIITPISQWNLTEVLSNFPTYLHLSSL